MRHPQPNRRRHHHRQHPFQRFSNQQWHRMQNLPQWILSLVLPRIQLQWHGHMLTFRSQLPVFWHYSERLCSLLPGLHCGSRQMQSRQQQPFGPGSRLQKMGQWQMCIMFHKMGLWPKWKMPESRRCLQHLRPNWSMSDLLQRLSIESRKMHSAIQWSVS